MQAEVISIKSERKEFFKLLLVTVLPLMIQTLFMQSISFIDQIMISNVGTDAVAAVGAANKILSIYNSFLYGSCSGCAMFLAQFWGNKDVSSFRKIFGVTIMATVSMGTIVTALVVIIPRQLLGLFANDSVVIELGRDYLIYVAASYFLMGIVFPLNYCLRSMNKVRVTAVNTVMSVFVNVIINYLLIYGKFGFPEMGVKGAALATTITRLVELIVLVIYFKASKCEIFSDIKEIFLVTKEYAVSFVKKAIPLVGNEMLWSLGTSIYFIIYGKSGKDALAAVSIMQTWQMLAKIASGSFCGASSIIVGNEIGHGNLDKVRRYCGRFHMIAVFVGVLSGTAILLLINPALAIYNIAGTEVGRIVKQCMYVLAVYVLINPINSINVEGIFRSGGDVKFITLMDMGSIWLIGMPYTIITGLFLHMDVAVIYMAYIVLEIYKLPLGYIRFKSGKWLHKLYNSESSTKEKCIDVSKCTAEG